MPKPKTLAKQNPKLGQRKLQDGRASLYLEFYLGRHETPVLDADGKPEIYSEGPSAGRIKYKITHERKKENLNLYIWLNPRNPQERLQNKNTLLCSCEHSPYYETGGYAVNEARLSLKGVR